MQKYLITLTFLLSFHAVFGQQIETDSLLHLLEKEKNDSLKVDLLYQVSDISQNNKDVLYYATKALELAEKINYKKGIADACNNIGYAYDDRGDNVTAMKYYERSLVIRKEINDLKGIAISLNNIGSIYSERSENEKALDYHFQSLKIVEQTRDSFEIATALHNISSLYRESGKIPEALEAEKRCLEIRQRIKDEDGTAGCYNNIGYIYGEQGLVDRAMEYYQKSLAIYEKANNKKGIALAYNNIGYIIPDHQKTLEYYFKGLKIYEEIGNQDGIGTAYNNIGFIYAMMKQHFKALEYYDKSLKIREETGNKEGIATLLNNIGKTYEEMGDLDNSIDYFIKGLRIKKEIGQKDGIAVALNNLGTAYLLHKDFTTAEKYCTEALKVANELKYPDKIRNAQLALSQIYAAQHRYKEAYEMYILYKEVSDSVSYSEARKTAAKMNIQFEFAKKEAQAQAAFDEKEALSKKEIEKQKLVRNYTAAGFSLLLFGSGIFVFLFNQRRKSLFNQTVSEVEMKALRAQMNPHFIFNSLNSINRYMTEKDTSTAGEYLTKFAKVMRMILENSQHKNVPLEDDLKALELYMQLESLRMKNKFIYEINVDPEIDSANTLIPPLILQPFVENAIWHGFSKKEGEGKINIYIKKEGDMIRCVVEDNGIGRVQTVNTNIASKEKKSLGMKITRARIDIINKVKKTKAGVELVDLEQGLRVIVNLPLELDF